MNKILGFCLNKFDPFLFDIPYEKNASPWHHKSIFFIYWDKKTQILEVEVLGKLKFVG